MNEPGQLERPKFKLGSIVYFDFGPPANDGSDEGILKEKHYAVVVQMDGLSSNVSYPHLVVCGLTSTRPTQKAGWVEIPPTAQNGLVPPSYLDGKKLYTVRKDRVDRLVGELEKTKVYELKRILVELLGLSEILGIGR